MIHQCTLTEEVVPAERLDWVLHTGRLKNTKERYPERYPQLLYPSCSSVLEKNLVQDVFLL